MFSSLWSGLDYQNGLVIYPLPSCYLILDHGPSSSHNLFVYNLQIFLTAEDMNLFNKFVTSSSNDSHRPPSPVATNFAVTVQITDKVIDLGTIWCVYLCNFNVEVGPYRGNLFPKEGAVKKEMSDIFEYFFAISGLLK